MNSAYVTDAAIQSAAFAKPRRDPTVSLATAHGTAAALKSEEPSRTIGDRIADVYDTSAGGAFMTGTEKMVITALHERAAKVDDQRATRKVRMAAKRRRGWA